jgi:hypothetical protein
MSPDCVDFLLTYKKFRVREVTDKLNIDIGHKLENGNPYYFSPNRFELINGVAPLQIVDSIKESLSSFKKIIDDNRKKIKNFEEHNDNNYYDHNLRF